MKKYPLRGIRITTTIERNIIKAASNYELFDGKVKVVVYGSSSKISSQFQN